MFDGNSNFSIADKKTISEKLVLNEKDNLSSSILMINKDDI
jgi:hypothetical protein